MGVLRQRSQKTKKKPVLGLGKSGSKLIGRQLPRIVEGCISYAHNFTPFGLLNLFVSRWLRASEKGMQGVDLLVHGEMEAVMRLKEHIILVVPNGSEH